jgi:hypothetical protein
MSSIQPQGENLRKAVQWIGTERQENPDASVNTLIDKACLTFNLTPAEAAYLERMMQGDDPDAADAT